MPSSTKYQVVIDTNVFLSAILWNGNPDKVLKLWKGKSIVLLLSPSLAEKIQTVLERSEATTFDINVFMESLKNNSIKLVPKTTYTICRDPDDNQILALATDGKADYIITGDKDLLALGTIEGIPIVKPKDFLRLAR
ncbi:putative toxin-antitoxin system toxin component, PIN family [Candidatus Gottesmanbacteria bacterium]|nr:putative toxin-antitoxin system toxin component, PIN family [Candidatus Gottesmanbacteria bacterium]